MIPQAAAPIRATLEWKVMTGCFYEGTSASSCLVGRRPGLESVPENGAASGDDVGTQVFLREQ